MDTTQMTPEAADKHRQHQGTNTETRQRPQRQSGQPPKREQAAARQTDAPPRSAQQRNGAARTAQQQRKAAGRSGAQPGTERSAGQKNKNAQTRTASRRKPARRSASSRKKKNTGASLGAVTSIFHRNKKNVASRSSARRETQAGEKRKQQAKAPTPAVIYTQPAPFNRSRLLVQLLTVTAVVLALVMGLSVFFKVEVITVTGADTYSAWAIRDASGISEGDNLLTFSKARASGQIKANLPYVESVRIGIKLPNTVNIMIEEADVVYAIKSHDGIWWLMNSNGKVVEQSNGAAAAKYTQVLGVTLDTPALNQQGIATEDVPTATDASGELVPVTVTGAQRLNVALQILKALEANDIVGDAASIDVGRLEDIVLWYGTRYQVNLGDSTRLEYKVACMNDVVLQMSEYQSGILDISFTTWTNQVGYTPFE